MHDYGLAFILGLVEGLTEFLPVSSTAHVRLTEALFGLDLANGYWTMFSIVIQLGAICCLPIYFRRRLAELVGTFPRGLRGDRTVLTHPLSLTLFAFACTAIPALFLTKTIGKHLEELPLMACALIVGGVLMWGIDFIYGRRRLPGDVEDLRTGQAVWIGLCQTLSAVFPGTSRSMVTIAAGEMAGLSRATALEFSFLLSIPTMLVATGYDLMKFMTHPDADALTGARHLDAHRIAMLLIGCAVSFIVAWGVVAWLMRWVRRRGFAPFAIYRILVGGAVLVWVWR